MKYFCLATLSLLCISVSHCAEIHLAQGLLSGEPTHDSVILQSRLTAVAQPIDRKIPGSRGVGRFEISAMANFSSSTFSEWLSATPENDFILKAKMAALNPSTIYYYRLIYGKDQSHTKPSSTASSKTLPAPSTIAPMHFIVTSCLNYSFFQESAKNQDSATSQDRILGYPALESIHHCKPDFVIFNGDCVYYDHPAQTRAKSQGELRQKWHEQYAMPRFPKIFAQTPTFWLKDDHDYRFNDSDPKGNQQPSHELGIATFREQVPVIDPKAPDSPTYRTHRITKDLQLWFVEGRDYRSENRMPDGPTKSLWGITQRNWLQQSIKNSKATYKMIISPTPMIGPDDGYKSDNHANLKGFHHEAQSFFEWLISNNIDPKKFFLLCGDRHWKYHSIHPLGFTEFSCGALNRENARLGRKPGDPQSNDPAGKIRQPYTDQQPSGGFLRVSLETTPSTSLKFFHHDDQGKILHQFTAP